LTRVRDRGQAVRRFIVENVETHAGDIAKLTSAKFGITRQAVGKHLQALVADRTLLQDGETRSRTYNLAPLVKWHKTYLMTSAVSEDQVWREDVAPSLGNMPRNVIEIWQYGFTEMFNNAIDHSEGTKISVDFKSNAATAEVMISDDGVGIFKKIQAALGLLDERHAVLELAKGKFTTDPTRHSGEGIFFTSRMFDAFQILSGGVYFEHESGKDEDWISASRKPMQSTAVWMKLSNQTARTSKRVFDRFASGEDYGFTKTIVPVMLAEYGDDYLVSRSQAKRLLARVEKFKSVMLDFRGVTSIGQAFADEVFRVFPLQHPEVELVETNANSAVKRMVSRARSHGA
jgi:anti-sigma regulatory factor (Ser/Thr protein kinase)